jgi:hypothetical protein
VSEKKHPRNIKNFVINPSFQLRMSFYFVSATMAVMGVLLFLLYNQISDVRLIVANSPGMSLATQAEVNEVLANIVKISIGFLFLMVIGIMSFGVVVSHRIAGPMYAIMAYIEDLKSGNYNAQRSLRPYDELSPIMDSLHELAAKLNKG